MKNSLKLILLTSLSCALTVSAQSGGSINAPEGVPTSVMKTLDEVEARIAISSLPYSIAASGSYYLTKNLTSDSDGILITASDVTLDLNGFTVQGSSAQAIHDGIRIEGADGAAVENVTVLNGSIRGFGNALELSFADISHVSNIRCSGAARHAVVLANAHANTIEQLKIRTISGDGLRVSDSNDNVIRGNHITEAPSDGNFKGVRIISGLHNLVVNNFCANYRDNYKFTADTVYGAEVKKLGKLKNNKKFAFPVANFSLNQEPAAPEEPVAP